MFLEWYDRRIHAGIANFCREKQWVLVSEYSQTRTWPSKVWHGDGIIAMIGNDPNLTNFIYRCDLPTVNLGNATLRPTPKLTHVHNDDFECGRLGARHLLERGFREFAIIAKAGPRPDQLRCDGFESLTQEHGGCRLTKVLIDDVDTYELLQEQLQKAIAALPRPLGIFGTHDALGEYAIRACLDSGLRVPEQVAVLAVNNDELLCDLTPVPLSSVDLNFERWGYHAASLLERMIHGERFPHVTPPIQPQGVVVRRSTDMLAVPDLRIARVLRYLWANLDKPLRTDHVADHIGLSRSKLDRLFEKHLHRSVSDELTRVRIERAQALLSTTELPGTAIATQCGFQSPFYFYRAFKRVTGLTIGEYREKSANS